MKQNMGSIDKIIRMLIAVFIAGLWYYGIIEGLLATVLLIIAGVFILTSFVGVCPLYLPFGISTKPGGNNKDDFSLLVRQGATIIDVRSPIEYSMGHLQQSMNIPIEELQSNLNRLPGKNKAIILCCASGTRSKRAMKLLRSLGFSTVYDGGSWMQLKAKLQ